MIKQNKVYSLLGFAARSRNLIVGYDAVIECIERKKAYVIIVALDASEKTKKNIKFFCEKYNVKMYVYGMKDELSHAIGNVNKVVFAIKNKNMALEIGKIIDGGDAIG